MKKNKLLILSVLPLPFLASCRFLSAAEYGDFIYELNLQSLSQLKIPVLLNQSGLLFMAAIAYGILFFVLSFLFFLLQTRDKSYLFHSLSALTAGAVYTVPFWSPLVNLPPEFWSASMVSSLLLLVYYQLFREWARKALYHRTKFWSYIVTSLLLSATLIVTLLSGHFPGLIKNPWPVPLLATALILDTLVNSLLSFQRKSDRSGIAGMLLLVPLTGAVLWTLFSSGFNHITSYLDNVYYLLPALMVPWQFLLSLSLTQRRFRKEQDRGRILTRMIEDEEAQKEKLEDFIQKKDEEIEEIRSIPGYSLECSRRLLKSSGNTLNLPDEWTGYQQLVAEGNEWPALASWNRSSSLLFAENLTNEPLIPLLYLQESFHKLRQEKPALLFNSLNNELYQANQSPERGISAAYLYFLNNEILCGTAGSVRLYMQKKGSSKIVPIRSAEKPATFSRGLGIKALTKEDGKPFRISTEPGDRIILVSCSLTDRELAVSGDIYGQKSLYRVLGNHESSNPENLVKAILKDFDDFDLGNTLDRQIYAAVFQRL
ncbi:MAG: SpoIIE family protein phosphatase [Spirochaetales bacterium]|nr:SpoIIE family protein phosphatase [Spirochaetales bacterium]